MGRIRLGRTSAITAVLLLFLGCTGLDAPTSASRDNSVLAMDASSNLSNDDRRAEHERLKDLLEQTRDSLKAERELHREEFKEARKAWQLFKKDWERRRRQGDELELMRCEPQEYTSDVELIGPDGGSLKVGPHELKIPKGALDHEVVISAVAPVSDLVEVQLQPEGLRFAQPAQLKLSYDRCVQPTSWLKLFIVYLSDIDQILEVKATLDKKGLKELFTDLDHFSRYAVAW
jgi:hypothetical protein